MAEPTRRDNWSRNFCLNTCPGIRKPSSKICRGARVRRSRLAAARFHRYFRSRHPRSDTCNRAIFFDLRSDSPDREISALEVPQQENASKWANAEIWAWIIGFYGAILLVGFSLAVPLFVLFYNQTYGGSWPLAIGLNALSWGFVYGTLKRFCTCRGRHHSCTACFRFL